MELKNGKILLSYDGARPFKKFQQDIRFCFVFERHERQLRVWQVCKKLKITERELDDIELGRGVLKLNVLKKMLKYYNRRIELCLVAPDPNEPDNAEPEEFYEAPGDSFEALEEEIEG